MVKFGDNPHLEGTRDEVITANMKLAYFVANKWKKYVSSKGIEVDDLTSICMEGLIKAYDDYDPTKVEAGKVKFSTYAIAKIEGRIQREVRDNKPNGLNISRNVKDLLIKIYKAGKEKHYKTAEDILKDYDVSPSYASIAIELLAGRGFVNSIDTPVYNNGTDEEITLGDTLGITQDYSHIFLNDFLDTLPERERKVIHLLFVEEKTQKEVGKAIGTSQVHVSRILDKIRERAEAFAEFGYTNENLTPPEVLKVKKETKKRKLEKEVKKAEKNIVKRAESDIKGWKELMVSRGLERVLNLLETTMKSYREIADETGVSYATIAYYGKEIRSPEHRKEVKSLATKKQRKTQREKKVEQKAEETAITNEVSEIAKAVELEVDVKREEASGTVVDISTSKENLSINSVQGEFAKILEIVNSTSAREVKKFEVQLRIHV